jgi:hypothetical protein
VTVYFYSIAQFKTAALRACWWLLISLFGVPALLWKELYGLAVHGKSNPLNFFGIVLGLAVELAALVLIDALLDSDPLEVAIVLAVGVVLAIVQVRAIVARFPRLVENELDFQLICTAIKSWLFFWPLCAMMLSLKIAMFAKKRPFDFLGIIAAACFYMTLAISIKAFFGQTSNEDCYLLVGMSLGLLAMVFVIALMPIIYGRPELGP